MDAGPRPRSAVRTDRPRGACATTMRRLRARRPQAARACGSGKDLAELVEHPLLSLAHALRVEAEEAALLRRLRCMLCRVEQPLTECARVIGRGLLGEQFVHRTKLIENLLAGHGTPWLEIAERALTVLRS